MCPSPHAISQGALFLNDGQCKVVQRQLEFDGGIAYGINCLLMEPSLGGRCDSFLTVEFMVSARFGSLTLTTTQPKGQRPPSRGQHSLQLWCSCQ